MDYQESLEWLYARQSVGIKLGLDNVRRLLAELDDPHASFRSIHIAGTNGKGSVARLLASTMHRAGHKTGLYTSPHLVTFRERILVDGEPIDRADVAEGLTALRDIVERLDGQGHKATFFEITTALAWRHFAAEGVEWVVAETGLGGRLDATNLLDPAVTVITSISMDHAGMLGESIGEIAAEKAGIMKPGVPCVTSARGDALIVIKATSLETRSPMSIVGQDYMVMPTINGFRLAHPGGEAEYNLAMAGAHQIENAGVVVAAVDALRLQGVDVPHPALQAALAQTLLPGRLESTSIDIDGRRIALLLDGAHNVGAMEALRYHLGRIDWAGFAWIAGFSADKAWVDMLDQCMPLANRIIGVPLRNERGLDPTAMGEYVTRAGFPFTPAANVEDALQIAAREGHTHVLIAGSLFLVGEARAVLTGRPVEEIRGTQ